MKRPEEVLKGCFRFMDLPEFDAVEVAAADTSPRALSSPQVDLSKGISGASRGTWRAYEPFFDFLNPDDIEAMALMGYE